MPNEASAGKLKKELGLFDVFALATGATLSAGLFLLPGPAFSQAGPAMILAYLLAAVPLVRVFPASMRDSLKSPGIDARLGS